MCGLNGGASALACPPQPTEVLRAAPQSRAILPPRCKCLPAAAARSRVHAELAFALAAAVVNPRGQKAQAALVPPVEKVPTKHGAQPTPPKPVRQTGRSPYMDVGASRGVQAWFLRCGSWSQAAGCGPTAGGSKRVGGEHAQVRGCRRQCVGASPCRRQWTTACVPRAQQHSCLWRAYSDSGASVSAC